MSGVPGRDHAGHADLHLRDVHPVMFRAAEVVVVVNKVDLLPHPDFDLDTFLSNLRSVNPGARVIHASARTGEGVDEWCAWLSGSGQTTLGGVRPASTSHTP
jgi:Ni2+-binding GTPase involved in maturation of urease and hydrogenase